MNPKLFESSYLAIMPEKLAYVIEARGHAIQAAVNRKPTKYNTVDGKVAVIGIRGYISSHPSIWTEFGIESSSEVIASQVKQAMSDPAIGAVILDIDSPGGTVHGLTSASMSIFNERGKKPLIAFANGLMASAAYFLGAAADEVISDPDSEVGSIGSVMVHIDASAFMEQSGVKATIIRSDEKKYMGSPYEALTDEARADFQATVDRYAAKFIEKVALYRGVEQGHVRSEFGNGGVLDPMTAKNVGMIDRVASLGDVIGVLLGKQKTQSRYKNIALKQKAKAVKVQAAAARRL